MSRMALLIKTLLEWGLAFANALGSGKECWGLSDGELHDVKWH